MTFRAALAACSLVAIASADADAQSCEPASTDMTLPDGFCATVFAEDLGRGRHLAVTDDGIVYVALLQGERGGVVALRDNDGDGRADERAQFGDHYGDGLEVHQGHLYFGTNTSILRYRLTPGQLQPAGPYEVWIDGFPEQRQHAVKPMAFDDQGNIYVNVGGPSNACQEQARTEGSPGQNPCPQREWQASIWRFENDRGGQHQRTDGHQFAAGIRNSVAIAWDPASKSVFVSSFFSDTLGANITTVRRPSRGT